MVKITPHPTKKQSNFDRGSSLVFDGDFTECAKWVGFAKSHMRTMVTSTPGTQTKIIRPVENVEIRLETRPNRVFIKAITGGFFVVFADSAHPSGLIINLGLLVYADLVKRPTIENPKAVFYWRGDKNEAVIDSTGTGSQGVTQDAGKATAQFQDGDKAITVGVFSYFTFQPNGTTEKSHTITVTYYWNNKLSPGEAVSTSVIVDHPITRNSNFPTFLDLTRTIKGLQVSPDGKYAGYCIAVIEDDQTIPSRRGSFYDTWVKRHTLYSLDFIYLFNALQATNPAVPMPTKTTLYSLGDTRQVYDYDINEHRVGASTVYTHIISSIGNPYFHDSNRSEHGQYLAARWFGSSYYYLYFSESVVHSISEDMTTGGTPFSHSYTYARTQASTGEIWLGKYDKTANVNLPKFKKISEVTANLSQNYAFTESGGSDSTTDINSQDYCFIELIVAEPKYDIYLYSVYKLSHVLDGWSLYEAGLPVVGGNVNLPYKVVESYQVFALVGGVESTLKSTVKPEATVNQTTLYQQFQKPSLTPKTDHYGRIYSIPAYACVAGNGVGSFVQENYIDTLTSDGVYSLFAVDREFSEDLGGSNPAIRPGRAYSDNGSILCGKFMDRVDNTVNIFAIDLTANNPAFAITEQHQFGTPEADLIVNTPFFSAFK